MHKKRRLYYLLALAGIFVTVLVLLMKHYRYGSFKTTATGLEYRVVSKGKGPSPQEGEIMLLNLSYKTPKGEVIFSTEDQGLPMAMPYTKSEAADGGLEEAITMLQKGTSMVFRLSAAKLFGKNLAFLAKRYDLKEDSKILLSVQLQDSMPEDAYKTWEKKQIAMLEKKQQEAAEQQLQKDKKIIADYLKDHKLTTAKTTSSGLSYVIDTPGEGAQPKQGDTVKVNYTGQLLDGKVFDTSLEEVAKQHGVHNPQRPYEPLEFSLGVGQVIQGWDEGIMLLNKGSKARLFIPSKLAYGSRDTGGGLIPPNSILVFDVELVDIH